ncbi:MAG: glycyl-radical enzyme activating protein [Deltaproteobacteria bacterium]|nr:glycyl-radical enzyme activating protein [Deltaproteobacteria bacterium]
MESAQNQDAARGLVFNIQRFSVHDGPGIRTTVFMKGCPLNCSWCSNPESQAFGPQLMVRDIMCRGCGACAAVCPQGTIRISAKGVREIDWERCDQCLVCVDACVYGALHRCGEYREVREVLEEVLRDRPFYRNSGGGVTVSGGEPLSQSEFVVRLLKACREEGLHTAIDTTGHAPWPKIREAVSCADLILWDVKHLDPGEHERTTGVDNRLILENLERAAGLTRIWLRVPLIAGFNDSVEHIGSVAALARKIGAEKVSLLSYHEGGRSKSRQIGVRYQFPDAQAPAEKQVDLLRGIIEKEGLQVGVDN